MARAESGDRVLEERATSPLLTSRVSGERCKLPQRGPRRAPATKRFSRILSVQSGVSRQFSAVYNVPRVTRATFAKTRAMNRLPQWKLRQCYGSLSVFAAMPRHALCIFDRTAKEAIRRINYICLRATVYSATLERQLLSVCERVSYVWHSYCAAAPSIIHPVNGVLLP